VNGRLDLSLAPESLDPLIQHIKALVLEELRREASPWLTRTEAADYLHWPLSRLEKRKDVPHHRDGGRVMYRRDELDAWLAAKRDKDPS